MNDNELLDCLHPWCGRVFKIKRKYWEKEKLDPQEICFNHCEGDMYDCDDATTNWKRKDGF